MQKALKKYPRAQRFVVNWDAGGSLGTDGGKIIYDRKRHIVWSEERSDFLTDDGSDGGDVRRTKSVQRILWSHVTDTKLQKMAAKFIAKAKNGDRNDEEAQLAYFSQLNKFGCARRTLKNWSRTYKVVQ